MSDIIDFTGITKLDIDPEQMLKATLKEGLDGVVIMGYKNGEEYFASSYADSHATNYLIDRCKLKLLTEIHEQDIGNE